MSQSTENQDYRVEIISKIWGYSTGMMFMCIPLTAITESGPILPIFVIVGAASATAAIWGYGTRQNTISESELKRLENRLTNLETIITYEEPTIQRKIQSLKSQIDA